MTSPTTTSAVAEFEKLDNHDKFEIGHNGWLTTKLEEAYRAGKEEFNDCSCKEKWTFGVVHRKDEPCYWPPVGKGRATLA